VSCEVLFELSLSLDVIASEVLLVSIIDCNCAEYVKDDTTTNIEGNWVLSAIVPQTLET
jgi:hypothetical protein